MEDPNDAVLDCGRPGFLLPFNGRLIQRFGRVVLASALLAAMTASAAYAGGSESSTGGGDGSGGTGGTPPGTTQCFISFGTGSDYFVGVSSTTLSATLNWSIPQGSFNFRSRFVATGADGGVTDDTGWVPGDPDLMDIGPASGQSGEYIPDPENSIDISGGTLFEVQFTDPSTGETVEADGETYPPDPVTGGC